MIPVLYQLRIRFVHAGIISSERRKRQLAMSQLPHLLDHQPLFVKIDAPLP